MQLNFGVGASIRARFRRAATVAVAASALGLGALAGAPAASAGVAQARAGTPVFGMDCSTSSGGSLGNYYGSGACTGAGKWRVAVSCSYGFTYTSIWVINSPGQTQTLTAGSCYWGVDSVTVQESAT